MIPIQVISSADTSKTASTAAIMPAIVPLLIPVISMCKLREISHLINRVLNTVYAKYPKVMINISVDGYLVSLILIMQFSTFKLGIHGNKHVHFAIIHPLT